jgi:hypothetical protein
VGVGDRARRVYCAGAQNMKKCTFCFPRIEVGLTVYAETCGPRSTDPSHHVSVRNLVRNPDQRNHRRRDRFRSLCTHMLTTRGLVHDPPRKDEHRPYKETKLCPAAPPQLRRKRSGVCASQ